MDFIPENKLFIKKVDDSSLPSYIQVVGAYFSKEINPDGTIGNKKNYICTEISPYVCVESACIETQYREATNEEFHKALQRDFLKDEM